MRALGFCVSVEHAHDMARQFTAAGIPARAVFAGSSAEERRRALLELKAGEVNVVFAVDLFNEGVDVPEIDTVLFLRPTESATVFLQQLGRKGPGVLATRQCSPHWTSSGTIGRSSASRTASERSLVPLGRSWERDVRDEFPFLPSGCQIQLDRQTQAAVLRNIKEQLPDSCPQIRALALSR